MGRFKIYDPNEFLSFEKGAKYGKCFLCHKKLKNVMGNVKRHYEQMHSVSINANAIKPKKLRSITLEAVEISENKLPNHKMETTKALETSTAVGISICRSQNNNSVAKSTKHSQSKPCGFKRNFSSHEDGKGSKKHITTATSHQVHSKSSPHRLVTEEAKCSVQQKDKMIGAFEKSKLVSESQNQLNTHCSNLQKFKLVEESDEIQIPCYSYINNITINSVESCQQLEFLKCLVETKAHVNIPLKTFQGGDSFQKALQNWKPNFQFNYSPLTIGEHIDRMTKKLHQEIKKIVTNKLIHLKLDVVSSTEGNVMLVNIQFINNFKIQVITLSAFNLINDDLATYLKEKVLFTLQRFKIDISSVFSIIKDNTNNVREYPNKCENTRNNGSLEEKCEDSNIYAKTIDYCQHLSQGFPGHAIHFVASDVINQLNENISQSRDSVKRLRLQMSMLKVKTLPLLDNSTSWFSVYDMIESLIRVHGEIENNGLLLVEVDWQFTRKFVESFRPIVNTALVLQSNDIIITGDFYREWLLCEIILEELAASNELALLLLEALRKRKLVFFENPSFLAALYLDPRFFFMGSTYLNDKQTQMAIAQLLQIFQKLKKMHENTTQTHSTNPMDNNLNDRYAKLEKHVAKSLTTDVDAMSSYDFDSFQNVDEKSVKETLEHLQFEERLPFETNILEYWNIYKHTSPIVAKIAEVALAAPATQATTSRVLNASSITLMKQKLCESNDNIQNLLLLRLNQDLVDKISLEH